MYENGASAALIAVAEKYDYYWHLQEKDMTSWWVHQVDRMTRLVTTEGERLIVLDPGQLNDGPGPDIINARIILDDYELCGPVEMHLRSGDWYKHGHDVDPDYGKVILHVVLDAVNGPDLPTLRLNKAWLGANTCHANRPLQSLELQAMALDRFKEKQSHLKLLASNKGGYHALLLGMIEILCLGRGRVRALHEVAANMGLDHWPDTYRWSGSNQSYPRRTSRQNILAELLKHSHLFHPHRYEDLNRLSWQAWSKLFEPLIELGLSEHQCREWVVNIYAPYGDTQRGYQIWQSFPIFRHYGVEIKLLSNLGLVAIHKISDQQGVLAFEKQYCSLRHCARCPLVHSHHTLTQLN